MISKEKIIQYSSKFSNNRPGVYFLIFRNEVVYVGQSCNAMNRIYHHRRDRRLKFSSYYILYLDHLSNEKRLEVEKKYITILKPEFNIKDNPIYQHDETILYAAFKDKFENYLEAEKVLGYSTTTIRNVVMGVDVVSFTTRNRVTEYLLNN